MNAREVAQFLHRVAAHDRRQTDDVDVVAWLDVLPPEMTLTDAVEALKDHRRAGNEWLMPSHIIERVRAVRKARLDRAGTPDLPGGLSWVDEKRWRELWCGHIKDGLTVDQANERADSELSVHRPDAITNAGRVAAIEALARTKQAPRV